MKAGRISEKIAQSRLSLTFDEDDEQYLYYASVRCVCPAAHHRHAYLKYACGTCLPFSEDQAYETMRVLYHMRGLWVKRTEVSPMDILGPKIK